MKASHLTRSMTSDWRSFLFGLLIGAIITFSLIQVRISATSDLLEAISKSLSGRFQAPPSQCLSKPSTSVGREGEEPLTYPVGVFDDSIARELAQKVRILCWVMTGSTNHHKAKVVRDTWGKKCNKLLFFSDVEDPTIPTVLLEDVHTGHNHLWGKTKQGFEYVYEKHLNDYDWFFKVDDDTFLIPENARYMLSRFSPEEPLWFGCKFKPYVDGGYNSGGAGYVLSREAVRRFVEQALKAPDDKNCRLKDDEGAEDVEIGRCLKSVGVNNGDSRDEYGRGRYFPFGPGDFVDVGNMSSTYWYWNYIFYKQKQGADCCSDTAVSFHYIDPRTMRMLHYAIYTLRPYGISTNSIRDSTPPPPPDEKLQEKQWIGADGEYEILMKSLDVEEKEKKKD